VEIYIVGNGIFGRIAHDLLAANGYESIIIDDKKSNAGSIASGNITKPSWVSGLPKAKQAYEDLDRLYGLEKFSPQIVPGKHIDLYYVPRPKTLLEPDIQDHVIHVGDGRIVTANNGVLSGKVLVAAGVWTEFLVQIPPMENIVGVSAIFQGASNPRFSLWAPYKQAISYSHDNETWFGDGTAIKAKNFVEEERVKATLARAKRFNLTNPLEINIGYRPYVKDHKEGYFAQVYENTWASTGGGKNGIVLAAIQAKAFLESL
jgi:hypothetical protein